MLAGIPGVYIVLSLAPTGRHIGLLSQFSAHDVDFASACDVLFSVGRLSFQFGFNVMLQ